MRKCRSPVTTGACPHLREKDLLAPAGLSPALRLGLRQAQGAAGRRSSQWMMDLQGLCTSPFLPGLTSLPAPLGSRFCLLPLPRAAGKVLLTVNLFHCLHCLTAPPEPPAPRRDGFLQEGSRPKEEPLAAVGTGQTALGRHPGQGDGCGAFAGGWGF